MPALHQAHADAILNSSLTTAAAAVAFTASVHPMRCRFMTANGSATASGTELTTGGGYTSGTGAPAATFSAASAGSKTTSADVTVTNMPAATIVGVELWDSTPARKWYGSMTSKTTNSGDTFTIQAGQLTASLG